MRDIHTAIEDTLQVTTEGIHKREINPEVSQKETKIYFFYIFNS